MDPLRQLAQLGERLGQILGGERDQLLGLARRRRDLGLDEPQPDRDRDEPLLGAVVQVALDAAALGVAGLDDAQPRGGELVARLRARDGQRDQLGERLQAVLRPRRQRLGLAQPGDQRPPRGSGHADRHGDARPEPVLAHPDRERAVEALVVDPGGRTRAPHGAGRPLGQLERVAEDEVVVGRAELADDRARGRVLVPQEQHREQAEQAAHLLGDRLEHLLRSGVARGDRGHPPQRRLLGGEPAELLLGLAAAGEVTHHRDHLAPAAGHDPGLADVAHAVELELVVERLQRPRRKRTVHALEGRVGHVRGQEVADVVTDDLGRGQEQQRVVVGPRVQIGAVAREPQERIGHRVDQHPVAVLDLAAQSRAPARWPGRTRPWR